MGSNSLTSGWMVLLILLSANSLCAVDRPTHIRWCLTSAGIPLDASVKTLVDTLRLGGAASMCAADALQLEAPSTFIDNALIQATRSSFELLTESAARALAYRKNSVWCDYIVQRLPKIKDPVVRVQLAGSLASRERYEGWPVIAAAIVAPKGNRMVAQEALRMTPRFVGMKDAEGQPIQLAEVLDRLIQRAPPAIRKDIIQVMVQIGDHH